MEICLTGGNWAKSPTTKTSSPPNGSVLLKTLFKTSTFKSFQHPIIEISSIISNWIPSRRRLTASILDCELKLYPIPISQSIVLPPKLVPAIPEVAVILTGIFVQSPIRSTTNYFPKPGWPWININSWSFFEVFRILSRKYVPASRWSSENSSKKSSSLTTSPTLRECLVNLARFFF